jgi:RNA polymerase-binding transcription factor DksA
MKGIQERLEEELKGAVNRLRRIDGSVALEDLPGVIGDNSPFADEVDEIQANEGREIGFATRTLLVERVHRLRNALEHLREGDYGTCVECGEPIAAARLRALPEVETCVRCQDRIERYGRQLERVEVEAGVGEDDE